MAEPLTVLNTSSHSLQLMQIQSYIVHHTVSSMFDGERIEFLPASAIAAVATENNIQAVVNQDPDLKTLHFPEHSRAFFSSRIFNEAKRIFIITMSERLGMDFLRVLLRENRSVDKNIPLPYTFRIHNEENQFWDDGDVERFLDAQPTACAPIFSLAQFDQKAAFRSLIPIVQAEKMSGRGDEAVWRVRFHREHLTGETGGEDLGERWFTMMLFEDEKEAQEDSMWAKRAFGFTCEYVYYLVGSP